MTASDPQTSAMHLQAVLLAGFPPEELGMVSRLPVHTRSFSIAVSQQHTTLTWWSQHSDFLHPGARATHDNDLVHSSGSAVQMLQWLP